MERDLCGVVSTTLIQLLGPMKSLWSFGGPNLLLRERQDKGSDGILGDACFVGDMKEMQR
jgi:hypothetical protein